MPLSPPEISPKSGTDEASVWLPGVGRNVTLTGMKEGIHRGLEMYLEEHRGDPNSSPLNWDLERVSRENYVIRTLKGDVDLLIDNSAQASIGGFDARYLYRLGKLRGSLEESSDKLKTLESGLINNVADLTDARFDSYSSLQELECRVRLLIED